MNDRRQEILMEHFVLFLLRSCELLLVFYTAYFIVINLVQKYGVFISVNFRGSSFKLFIKPFVKNFSYSAKKVLNLLATSLRFGFDHVSDTRF